MKKKIVTLTLATTLIAGLLTGCQSGNSQTDVKENSTETASTASGDELTKQEQEAVEAGLINLDGTLPIITDPEAFEERAIYVWNRNTYISAIPNHEEWGSKASPTPLD